MRKTIVLFTLLLPAAYAQMDSPILVSDSTSLPPPNAPGAGQSTRKTGSGTMTSVKHQEKTSMCELLHPDKCHATMDNSYIPGCYIDDKIAVNLVNSTKWTLDLGNVKFTWPGKGGQYQIDVSFPSDTPTSQNSSNVATSWVPTDIASKLSLRVVDASGKETVHGHSTVPGQFRGILDFCSGGCPTTINLPDSSTAKGCPF